MANNIVQRSHDWLQSPHTNLLAWSIPCIAVIAGLFAPVLVRTAILIVALCWMELRAFSTQSGADALTAGTPALTILR